VVGWIVEGPAALSNRQKLARALVASVVIRAYHSIWVAARTTCSDGCVETFSNISTACAAELEDGSCTGECWKSQRAAMDTCLDSYDHVNLGLWESLLNVQQGPFSSPACKLLCLGATPEDLAEACKSPCGGDCFAAIDEVITMESRKECLVGYLRQGAFGDNVVKAIDSVLNAGMLYDACESDLQSGNDCSLACRAAIAKTGFKDDPCMSEYIKETAITRLDFFQQCTRIGAAATVLVANITDAVSDWVDNTPAATAVVNFAKSAVQFANGLG